MTYSSNSSLDLTASFALKILKDWYPDIVIVAGDVAFEKVALGYTKMKSLNSSLPGK